MKTIIERISAHPFFDRMQPEHIQVAAKGAAEITFQAGDTVLKEGEPANRFYLIESGGVALEAHQPADGTFPIESLTKGEALGWSWLLSPFVWHFQARALEPTTMIVLDAAELLIAAETDHDFGYELLKRTSHVLMDRLRATRHQFVETQLKLHQLHYHEPKCADLATVPHPTTS